MSDLRARRIAVAIDQLVVHDLPLPPSQRGRLLRAVRDELAQCLTQEEDGRSLPTAAKDEPTLDAGAIAYDPDVPIDPEMLGRAIARAVHGGLTSWPR
jgi:hypothetical protein